jgi:hypothetical protein
MTTVRKNGEKLAANKEISTWRFCYKAMMLGRNLSIFRTAVGHLLFKHALQIVILSNSWC